MIGEAACKGTVTASTWSSTAGIACTLSCSVLRIDGVFGWMLKPSEAETARSTETVAEKTNEVPVDSLAFHAGM